MISKPLVTVQDLQICYLTRKERQLCVNGISFEIRRREVLGILGESGSGKTTLALAILGLLPPAARVLSGSIRLEGREILALRESELAKLRGSVVSMVFQEAELTLNPVIRVLDQVSEIVAAHNHWGRSRCRKEASRILTDVGLDSNGLFSAYPHQLSGGQRQRVALAQALACRPALVIADEPTTALDVTLQLQWLKLIKDLCQRLDLAVLLITHDPGILAGLAHRVLILYRGRIIEEMTSEKPIRPPLHPYTKALLNCAPPPPGAIRPLRNHLPAIYANFAFDVASSTGCPYELHCPDRLPGCGRLEPPETRFEDGRRVRCFKYGG